MKPFTELRLAQGFTDIARLIKVILEESAFKGTLRQNA